MSLTASGVYRNYLWTLALQCNESWRLRRFARELRDEGNTEAASRYECEAQQIEEPAHES